MSAAVRIYSEMLPYEDVIRADVVALLRRYEIDVVLAVRPWQIEDLPRVALTLADANVSVAVWPMLADDEGRWASAKNAAAFAKFVRTTVNALDAARAPVAEVLLDLEPPFAEVRALASHAFGLRPAAGRAFAGAEAELAALAGELRGRGIAVSAAIWPLVALDPPAESGWQRILGTPVDALEIDHVSVMVYTSILEGWSRGSLRRKHTLALLDGATRRTMRRWGVRGGVSLGCVGTGAFEDEPIYRSPEELAEDVAIARAAGAENLSLFDLAGVLARPPPEAWLEAFAASPSPAKVDLGSRRVIAARTLARAATWAFVTRGSARSRR